MGKKPRYSIVPSEWVAYGVPRGAMPHNEYSTYRAASAALDAEIRRIETAVPTTGAGGDYLACRLGEAMEKTVVDVADLRPQTSSEADEMRRQWPQFS